MEINIELNNTLNQNGRKYSKKSFEEIVNDIKRKSHTIKLDYTKQSFDYGEHDKAYDFFLTKMLNGEESFSDRKYDEIFKDMQDNSHPSIIVCSRQCGMTTHMLAYYLARIATIPFYTVWFVTRDKKQMVHMFDRLDSEEILFLSDFKFRKYQGEIECTSMNSKIKFVSVSQEHVFHGQNLPNEIVYNDMAFINNKSLGEFLNELDVQQKARNQHIKEVCYSAPSKNGSIFNFLALICDYKITFPWYEVHNPKFDNEHFHKMMTLLGEDEFAREYGCCLSSDTFSKIKETHKNNKEICSKIRTMINKNKADKSKYEKKMRFIINRKIVDKSLDENNNATKENSLNNFKCGDE